MHETALFAQTREGRANRVAVEFFENGALRLLTWAEVEARTNRMARELASRGLKPGDRLCLHLANRMPFVDLVFACAQVGVICVPINILYKERELRHILMDSEPSAVVTHAESDAHYADGVPRWTVDELLAGASGRSAERIPSPAVSLDSPALIIYTSGTTGTAKGAVLSHNNLVENATTLVDAWQITHADRYLAVLPLFHVHGLANGLGTWTRSGCVMRLLERFDQKTIAAQFRDFKPTLFFGVPTVYVRLMDPDVIPAADARTIESHMRLFVSGSAPLSGKLFQQFRDRFGHAILERYGMSEALMIISNPYDGERKPGMVGHPLPGVSVRIVRDGEVAEYGEGEIQVKSPALFKSYWRNPDATSDAFTKDGWFRTGDLGVKHDDGYFELMGRNHDLIISGGFNVYPREVEDALVEFGVREAAVVGVADAVKGEVPVGYVVADGPFDAATTLKLLRIRLASFKIPRALIRLDSLPRNAMGKIQKHLLPPWKP
jgi:malonyl-CoA/methylmalonyl-CoA synthetase